LSHDVATAIVGTHTLEELEENVKAVRTFEPFSDEELLAIEQRLPQSGPRLLALTA